LILLDTHIWAWWVNGDPKLAQRQQDHLDANQASGLGIAVYSCWEIAKQVELGKMVLSIPIVQWMNQAVTYSGLIVFPMTPEIAVESTRLPPTFHKDPADQIIVATARIHKISLLTADAKILAYPHVTLLN